MEKDTVFETAERYVNYTGKSVFLTGKAGTGKTTFLRYITSTTSKRFIVLAPTGVAAINAGGTTIHSFFLLPLCPYLPDVKELVTEYQMPQHNWNFRKDKIRLIRSLDLLIIDEISMVRADLLDAVDMVLRRIRRSSQPFGGLQLLMIGDAAQLPPVGHEYSPALSEDYMSRFGGVCFSELTTVVRQGAESGILYNATMLRTVIAEDYASGGGLFPTDTLELSADGFADVERIGGGELLEALSDAFDRYGEDETIVLCRSNKRANRYNAGIRGAVQYKEERLVRGDRLMVVKNCYHFTEGIEKLDYIANGDIAELVGIGHYEERFGLHFADARLCFPDYDDLEIEAKVCLDTLDSESASLTWEQQNALYQGVMEDYQSLSTKKKRYDAVKADPFYNALQLKYANAITCHKSQGGQWKCVFIDNPLWQEEFGVDDYKWLYTAITRAVEKVYLVNFKDEYFI